MNNFTPRAQQVLAHARREADRFNHHYIGTEHLLLGLLKLGKGVAVTILENLGVELNAVRQQVEQQIGRGTEPQAEGNIPYTPRVRKVLALANREAQELNHTYVGTEHLLLGLIRDGDGVAGQILRHFGVDLEQARRELLEETGFGEGQWSELMVVSANPSTQTNLTHCFVATDVERISEQHLESTEDLTVHLLTPEQVRDLLLGDRIKQALHAAPLWSYFAENRLL